jgi:hypothetical protein
MSYAPLHDWTFYEATTQPYVRAHLRAMSLHERFLIYKDLHRLLSRSSRDRCEQQRLDESRWNEKLQLRKKMLKAFVAFK